MIHSLIEIWASMQQTFKDCLSHTALLVEISIAPFFYAIIAMYIYQDVHPDIAVFYMLLGAGAMGMWESTLLGGAWSLRDERDQGLLEYYLCMPCKFGNIILGKCLVYSAIGLIVILEVLLIISFKFDLSNIQINFSSLILGIIMLVLSFTVMGFLLSHFFLVTRSFVHISNLLSDSIKMFSGVLFPVMILPIGFKIVAYVLPSAWAISFLRNLTSSDLERELSALQAVGFVMGLCSLYVAGSALFASLIERRVRMTGDLSKV